jgi:16S rRNA (cytidine1402-2'-O)-methyltransferase
MLKVIATPIGNLGDISPRAMEALQNADMVACEDTRRTGQLFHLLAIKAPRLVSFHKENERGRLGQIIDALKAGKIVALVSDGGMPGISDPGAGLVAASRAAGIAVEVIPGASAVVVAVAGSGFDGPFTFFGFLPRKGKERKALLARIAAMEEIAVLYESPFRIQDTVEDMLTACGNRPAWLARELTKMHEEWLGPDLASLQATLAKRGGVKGECVLVIQGAMSVPVK